MSPAYAGLGRRLAAGLLDTLLGWVILSIAAYVAVPEVADGTTLTTDQEESIAYATLVGLSVWINLLIIGEWRWGRTPGKAIVGITVATEDGSALSWNRALMRNLLRLPDLVAIFFTVPESERRQRLGDRAARTIVLRGRAGHSPLPLGGTLETSAAPPGAAPLPAESPGLPGGSWGPVRVVGGLGVLLGITLLAAVVVSAFDRDLESLGSTLALQSVLVASLIGVSFAMARPGGTADRRELGLGASSRSPWWPAVGSYLGYIGCALILSLLLSPEQEDITRELGYGESFLGDFAAAFLIIAAAPIAEEIFFRGFMFAGIRAKAPFAVAAIVSSGIWGLFHYTGSDSWPVILQLTIFGLILSWLYERTGSIRAPIALHVINNAIAFIVVTAG